MGFSRQEYWSGLPCCPSGDLPDPGIECTSLKSPALADRFFITSATQNPPVSPVNPLLCSSNQWKQSLCHSRSLSSVWNAPPVSVPTQFLSRWDPTWVRLGSEFWTSSPVLEDSPPGFSTPGFSQADRCTNSMELEWGRLWRDVVGQRSPVAWAAVQACKVESLHVLLESFFVSLSLARPTVYWRVFWALRSTGVLMRHKQSSSPVGLVIGTLSLILWVSTRGIFLPLLQP